MQVNRVIEDSEEDDCTTSPEQSPAKAATLSAEVDVDATIQASLLPGTGSTDSVVFQAVYNETFPGLDVRPTEQPPLLLSPAEFPTLADIIANPRMSTSPPVGIKKLKRSNTTNHSSPISISEPGATRKAKRAKSLREVDKLPQKSKQAADKDIYDFPSDDEDSFVRCVVPVKSRNAQRDATKMTYGKQLKKSKTAGVSSSPVRDYGNPPISKDDGVTTSTSKRPRDGQDDLDLNQNHARLKRVKNDPSVALKSVNNLVDYATTRHKSPLLSGDVISTTNESLSVQVPRSASEEARTQYNQNSTSAVIISSVPKVASSLQNVMFTSPSDTFIEPQTFEPISISIGIPNTLTSSQKKEYEILSMVSTISDRRSFSPPIMESVDPHQKFSGDSSTIPNDTQRFKISSPVFQTPASPPLHYSSPPITSSTKRVQRAKSAVTATAEPNSSDTSPHSNNAQGRLRRSKTMQTKEARNTRESSYDELSMELHHRPLIEKTHTFASSTKRSRSRPVVGEPVSLIEYHSAESRLPTKNYSPQQSRCSSKSMSVQDSDASVEPESVVPEAGRQLTEGATRQEVQDGHDREASIAAESKTDGRTEKVTSDRKLPSIELSKISIAGDQPSSPKRSPSAEDLVSGGQMLAQEQFADSKGTAAQLSHALKLSEYDATNMAKQQDETSQKRKPGRPRKTPAPTQPESVSGSATTAAPILKKRRSKTMPAIRSTERVVISDDEEDKSQSIIAVDFVPVGAKSTHRLSDTPEIKMDVAATPLSPNKTKQNTTVPSSRALELSDTKSKPSPKDDDKILNAELPKTPSKAVKNIEGKSGGQHSPLQSGKVPYRIGLSRKTRIAPLLKIMKKPSEAPVVPKRGRKKAKPEADMAIDADGGDEENRGEEALRREEVYSD